MTFQPRFSCFSTSQRNIMLQLISLFSQNILEEDKLQNNMESQSDCFMEILESESRGQLWIMHACVHMCVHGGVETVVMSLEASGAPPVFQCLPRWPEVKGKWLYRAYKHSVGHSVATAKALGRPFAHSQTSASSTVTDRRGKLSISGNNLLRSFCPADYYLPFL